MTAREIASTLAERPFAPFRIVMSDGRAYDVKHPELLLVGMTTTYLGVPSVLDEFVVAEKFVRLANDHITTLVPLVAADPT